MKENEMLYPELGRYPLYWTAVAGRRDVVVNEYMDAELLEEKENELRNNPVIMLTEKAARVLECGHAALFHGESFGKTVRELFSAFKPNAIIHFAVFGESGKYRDVLFDSCMYGNEKDIHAVEIALMGEWQEDVQQHHASVTQDKPSYSKDHGC